MGQTRSSKGESALSSHHLLVSRGLGSFGLFPYSWDSQGRYSQSPLAEAGFRRLTGHRKSLLRKTHDWLGIVHLEDRARVEAVQDRLRNGESCSLTYRIIGRSGEIIWLSDDAVPVLSNEHIIRVDGVLRDVTEVQNMSSVLDETHARLRLALETAPIALFSQDAALRYTQADHTQIVNESEAWIGKTDFDMFPLYEDALTATELKSSIIRDGRPVRGVFSVTLHDGSVIDLDFAGEPVRDAYGNIIGITCASADVTERRLAQQRLIESELRIRSVFANAAVGVGVLTGTGELVTANDALCEFFGVAHPEECPRYPFADGLDLSALQPSPHTCARLHPFETIWHRTDGSEAIGMVAASVATNNEGRPQQVMAVCVDVTVARTAEEALAGNERLLRRILDSLAAFVCIFDPRTQEVSYANGSALEYLDAHLDSGERRISDVLHVDDRDRWSSYCRRLVLADDDAEVVADFRMRDGGEELSLMKVLGVVFNRAGDGSVADCLCTALNITGDQQARRRTDEYQAALVRLAAESALAEERERRRIAAELHDSVGQMLAMGRMKLRDLMKAMGPPTDCQEIDDIVLLIEQALNQTRHLSFELSPPVLSELGFEAAVAWLSEELRQRFELRVDLVTPTNPLPLSSESAVVLYQSVRELLMNVVKHAKVDVARVSIGSAKGRVAVSVRDSGVGFDLRESSNQPPSAFGLFSIRERLKYMGGTLTVRSHVGRGTTATVTVPFAV